MGLPGDRRSQMRARNRHVKEVHKLDIAALKRNVAEAYRKMEAAGKAFEDAGQDADYDALKRSFDEAEAAHKRAADGLERGEALIEARAALPVSPVMDDDFSSPSRSHLDAIGRRTPDTPRVSREPLTYEKHSHGASFFRDLYGARQGQPDAQERLHRHHDEMRVELGERAVNSTDSTGGDFVPPLWLMDASQQGPRSLSHRVRLLQRLPEAPPRSLGEGRTKLVRTRAMEGAKGSRQAPHLLQNHAAGRPVLRYGHDQARRSA